MGNSVRIAIASGKGGTGKTTVATNLAVVAAASGLPVSYLDCDVEEPNAHIFLHPDITSCEVVAIPVPAVDKRRCTLCGACGGICQYSAIVQLGDRVLTFPELCHGCGGCSLVCPEGAITEENREVGVVERGVSDGIRFVHGRLRVGEAMPSPVIRKVKEGLPGEGLVIADAPPGTSCPVVTTISGSDFVVLVTEPTPFGVHDLRLAVDTLRELGLPCGVIVNRCDVGNDEVFRYCRDKDIRILVEIPDDRRVAEAYSRGEMAAHVLPEYKEVYSRLLGTIQKEAEEAVWLENSQS